MSVRTSPTSPSVVSASEETVSPSESTVSPSEATVSDSEQTCSFAVPFWDSAMTWLSSLASVPRSVCCWARLWVKAPRLAFMEAASLWSPVMPPATADAALSMFCCSAASWLAAAAWLFCAPVFPWRADSAWLKSEAVAEVNVTGPSEPSDWGKFTVNDPSDSVPNTSVPPLKLSVMVEPWSWPVTLMVLVDTDWLGGVPESVSTSAVPFTLVPLWVHWMKMTPLEA